MIITFNNILKFLLGFVVVLYPVLIFFSIVIFDVSVNHLSVFIVIFAALYFLVNMMSKERRRTPQAFISPLLLCLIGLIGLGFNSDFLLHLYPSLAGKTKELLKLYPLLVNMAWLIVFGTSLIFPPTFVFQIVSLVEKNIKNISVKQPLTEWSFRATIAWCVFFILDTIVAWLTVFSQFVSGKGERISDAIWGIYNGGISYIIMGIIFVVQFFTAKKIIKKCLQSEAQCGER